MKTNSPFTSHILAASVAGAAIVKLGSASFTAAVNGEVVVAIAASVAVLAFAAYDYSRRIESLRVRTSLLRPALPIGSGHRAKAYGIASVRRSAIVERVA